MKTRYLLLFYLLVTNAMLYTSCSPYPEEVRKALHLASNNATELKRVLDYYKEKDSLKYEAACFLIANMPYHQSREEVSLPSQYDDYFATTDSIFHLYFGNLTAKQIQEKAFKIPDSIRNALRARYTTLPTPTYSEGKKDIETVTADFLKDNIETAFNAWHTSPLLKGMSFEEFKEAVLPYRMTDEPLMHRKSELLKHFYPILNSEGMVKITTPIERYKMYILKQQRISYYTERNLNLELYDLFLPSTEFNCHNQVNWTGNILRACGVPICYEFTPQWPDRENRHFWSASPDSNGVYIPYSTPRNNLREDWNDHLKYAGKVYRKTFAANKATPFFLKAKKETVPELLSIPTLQDETYRYHQTVSLVLPFSIKTKNKLAYLSFITRSGIVPVAWGTVDAQSKKASFHQVPLSMTFILSYYEGDSIKAIGEPFRLIPTNILENIPLPLTTRKNESPLPLTWNGKNLLHIQDGTKEKEIVYKEFKCDTSRRIDVHLTRKYPLKDQLLKLHKQLKGAYILASNSRNGRADTITILADTPKPDWQTILVKARKKYRYLSFQTRNRRPLNIAEIEFYGYKTSSPRDSLIQKLKLDVDEPCWNSIDEDVETFVSAPVMNMELENASTIKELRFIPRTANNRVVKGDFYSLYYFQDGGWRELEGKKAVNDSISFKNVPTDGLYLLRNPEHGREELPFLYCKGQQIWISQFDLVY